VLKYLDDNRRAYWQAYIDSLKEPMRVRDWGITLTEEFAAEDAGASVSVIYGRNRANIQIAQDFDTYEPEEQRQMIVHELMHIHAQPMGSVLQRVTESRTEAWLLLATAFHSEALEHMVDLMAEIVAAYVPLPPSEEEQTTGS
jgi:hypothetical protein